MPRAKYYNKETGKWEYADSAYGSGSNVGVDFPNMDDYVKFKETERGKTIYHGIVRVVMRPGDSSRRLVETLNEYISEQMIYEAISAYEVTLIHTTSAGVSTTYTGHGGEYIEHFLVGANKYRKAYFSFEDRGGEPLYDTTIFETDGTIEVIVKTPSDVDLAGSPHQSYINKERDVVNMPGAEWETYDDIFGTRLVPSVSAVQSGLLHFSQIGQTYTSYEEMVSSEPITVALQPKTFYYFGNTPKITFNREAVSKADVFCCFMFSCGDVATELRDAVKASGSMTVSYGWPAWNMPDTIRPHRTYLGIIRHGIPYVEEYRPVDTNDITNLLGWYSAYVDGYNSDLIYVLNEALTEARELYNKYSYMGDGLLVIDDTVQTAIEELTVAKSNLVERVEPDVPEIVCTAHTAVGGEKYYLTTGTTQKTATEGMHLIKVTVPASPEGYSDTVYQLVKMYLSVKSGSYPSMNTNTDKYAITFSSYQTKNSSIYFKPTSDTVLTTFRMSLEVKGVTPKEDGTFIVAPTKKYADAHVVSYNGLL